MIEATTVRTAIRQFCGLIFDYELDYSKVSNFKKQIASLFGVERNVDDEDGGETRVQRGLCYAENSLLRTILGAEGMVPDAQAIIV